MKKRICLLMTVVMLLTGCGGSAPAETEAPVTEPMVTTEPTTVPTEPKTFFEEQGFAFWEGFEVHDTLDDEGNLDGGIIAWDTIQDSTECKVTITSGNREETTYHLADTKVEVIMDEYTLAEFDKTCNEKKLRTENIKNPSDSLYKAFKEEDSSLTKEAWSEQYQDYKVIHCQVDRTIRTAREVENAKLAMNIGQSQWYYNWNMWAECIFLLNSTDGTLYESAHDAHPGMSETFPISTESGAQIMCAVADLAFIPIDSGHVRELLVQETFFVMTPADSDDLMFVFPVVGTSRTLEKLEEEMEMDEASENPWEQKTFAEYTEGNDHLKYYFLSPFHH